MKTKMIYIIGMACMTGTLSAQTVVDYSTFEQKVLDYSQTLKTECGTTYSYAEGYESGKKPLSSPAVDATGKLSVSY